VYLLFAESAAHKRHGDPKGQDPVLWR